HGSLVSISIGSLAAPGASQQSMVNGQRSTVAPSTDRSFRYLSGSLAAPSASQQSMVNGQWSAVAPSKDRSFRYLSGSLAAPGASQQSMVKRSTVNGPRLRRAATFDVP